MSQDARHDEEQNTERHAQILNLQYYDTSQVADKPMYKDLLTNQELYSMRVIPIQATQHQVAFGITNTTSQQTMTTLRQRFLDQQISFALISDVGYREYMQLYDPPKQVVYKDIDVTSVDKGDILQTVSGILEQVKADDMLGYLAQQAHKLAASDIHIENQTNSVRIRFRIDGVLHPIAQISNDKSRVLLAAIASAGGISTSSDEAQQGHIAQKVKLADGKEVDLNLRLETVPAINGTDVVMRLFNMRQDMYNLDRLGLSEKERAILDDIIKKPSGLVLAVGPTGSGKTTTLYSILNSLNSPERKIITIEDPVEYRFEGITQISVTSKTGGETNFADKLRAVLRLDPDIVMVGEIRDNDTAKTALQASLTGHLVLSTFHASSAAAALTRLMDSIGENPLFASAIRMVMAQRLVRRLDDSCKQEYTPDEQTLALVKGVVDGFPTNIPKPDLANLKLFKPGTSAENPFGYKGQVALREQFLMSEEILKLLQGDIKGLTTQGIERAAIASGMTTMLQAGMLHVLAGETTLDEVYRVVG